MARDDELRTWSFIALLVGGLLILAGGLAGGLMMFAWGGWWGMGMPMMDGVTVGPGWFAGMAWWMMAWSVLTGGAAVLAAARIRAGGDAVAWGTVGIAAGALSLLAMGGYMLGALSAIVGGALAVATRDRRASAPPSA